MAILAWTLSPLHFVVNWPVFLSLINVKSSCRKYLTAKSCITKTKQKYRNSSIPLFILRTSLMGRGQIGLGRGNGGRVCFGVCVCCCEEVEESLILADFV